MGIAINILTIGLVVLVSVLSVVLIREQNRLKSTAASLKRSYRRFGGMMDKLETFVEEREEATSPTILSDVETVDSQSVAVRRRHGSLLSRQNSRALTPWMLTEMLYSVKVEAHPKTIANSFCPYCHGESHNSLPGTQKWLVEDYMDLAWDSGQQAGHTSRDEALAM
ncbi:MAG: hypothetical protein OXD31_14270 [Chloroflexi bacterium]|nr:hypothetical protein [Chloroflexota bacterium]